MEPKLQKVQKGMLLYPKYVLITRLTHSFLLKLEYQPEYIVYQTF